MSNRNDRDSIRNQLRSSTSSKHKKHKHTTQFIYECHFLDIVLEHATLQFMNIWVQCMSIQKYVNVLYKWCTTMQGHLWMICVCVPMPCKWNEVNYIFDEQWSLFPLSSHHLACTVVKSFFEALYHHHHDHINITR